MSRKDINSVDWLQQTSDQPTGYILEVHLDYPEHLHNDHNGYPIAPDNLKVNEAMLSPYCQQLKGSLVCSSGTTHKLLPHLRDKKSYILHYRNLRLYLALGMKLRYIHRVIRFDESAWMSPYINCNTQLRKEATTDFEKKLFKLLKNAGFGKTMENFGSTKTLN